MNRHVGLVAVLLVVLAIPFATADVFVRPPETNLPPGSWDYPFPYQRNALIDFSTNPNTWPADPNYPAGRELAPSAGNYILEGTHDDPIFESDFIAWTGNLDWYADDPTKTSNRQGIIGIHNKENTQLQLAWHLDNLIERSDKKHLYLEVEFFYGGTGTWSASLGPGDGAQVTDSLELQDQSLGGGWWRWNGWAEIRPNPTYENLFFTFTTDATTPGTILIDNMHVATECVPEPGTFLLFGLGGVGLVIWRRRKK